MNGKIRKLCGIIGVFGGFKAYLLQEDPLVFLVYIIILSTLIILERR